VNHDAAPKPTTLWVRALVAVLFGAELFSWPANAQELRVGCDLVRQYNDAEVKMLLQRVRSTVGDGEANALHDKYVGLRNDCRSNQKAFRVVRLSEAMQKLLDEYGVHVPSSTVSQR
jgi:hypothetical protein